MTTRRMRSRVERSRARYGRKWRYTTSEGYYRHIAEEAASLSRGYATISEGLDILESRMERAIRDENDRDYKFLVEMFHIIDGRTRGLEVLGERWADLLNAIENIMNARDKLYRLAGK